MLQTVEPLKQLLGPLVPGQPSLDASLAPALAFVSRMFSAFIDATRQNQYTLYGKSDKAPVEVVIADRTRAAVVPALAAALDLLNHLEDGALARPSSSSSAPQLAHALWSARLALWERLIQWGGYLESDDRAAALVAAEARRASSALAMYGAAEATAVDEGLAGKVLRTLDALERLDHGRAALTTDVVGWCLASPERCHVPARILLASLLRFHVLTHTLEAFFTLLSDAALGLFDPALPTDTLDPLYALVASGPLTDRAFRNELAAAVRSANLGGRRGTVWAKILRNLSTRVRDALADGGEVGSKRKRASVSGSGARLAAILSRLIKIVLDASARARPGDEDIEAAVGEAAEAFGDDFPTPTASEGKKKRKSIGGSDSTLELLFSARLRVARSATLLQRDAEFISRAALKDAFDGFALPELRLEAFHTLYTALALSSDASVIDAILTVLDGSAKRAWSGRDASVTDKTLAAAVWTLAAEAGLSVFECGSQEQLDRLAGIIVSRAQSDIDVSDGLTVARAVARVLGSAETWELANLRAALLRALVAAAAKDGGGFAVLAACPAPWLGKSARASLLTAAYEADASADDETRAAIRAWLARLADTDVLGPLTDANVLKRLLKTGDGTARLSDATLALAQRAFAALVKSSRDTAPLIAALGVLKKPFGKMDVRSRTAAAFFDLADPTGWEGELREMAVQLADAARSNLAPRVEAALAAPAEHIDVLRSWLSLARFQKRLGGTADDMGSRLLSAVLKSSSDSTADAAVVALDLITLSSADDSARALAAYIVLRAALPSSALDEAFRTFAGTLTAESYSSALTALLPLLLASGRELEGALRAAGILVSAPVSGSGKALHTLLPQLLAALEAAAGSTSAGVLEQALGVISALVDDRTGLLRPTDAAVLLSALNTVLLPSSPNGSAPAPHLLPLAISPLLTLARHRADLALAHLPSVVGALSAVLPLLQRARPGLRHKSRRPWWLASDPSANDPVVAHAALLARTLTALATAKLPTTSEARAKTLAGPLAKHAPAVLVAYARAASDPWAALAPAVRRELEPGLFALCDVVTAGGRADGRGREGEGVGVPFGLGEAHGEAEREVWADVWKSWARKRYTGRG